MTWAIFAINLMALAEQTSNRSHFLHGEEEFKKSYQYLGGISGGSWHEGSCSQVPGAPCGSGTGNFITGSGVRSAAAAALVLLFCCDAGFVLTTMYILCLVCGRSTGILAVCSVRLRWAAVQF
jgi:hypothetical protein